MAPGEVRSIRTTDPMVILREKGISSRNLLIRYADYDTIQQRKIIPIQEMKAAEMEMRKRRMVKIPNRGGQEEGLIMNPDSSAGIYFTVSLEAQCRLIAQNHNMKDEEKINNTKVNYLKRDAHINQRATSFTKIVTNIPNDMMVSEDNSTPLLQVLIYLLEIAL